MKHFINIEENEIYSEEDLKDYYESLRENGEWTCNHMTFDEWLNDQEQFDECEKIKMEINYRLSGNKVIVNTTPHNITFGGEGSDVTFIVPPSGIILNAKVVEKEICHDIVSTEFVPSSDGIQLIHNIHEWFETTFDIEKYDLRIVGSIIAVNAYRPWVVGLTPLKGFERVPPNEKRMNIDKFTIA